MERERAREVVVVEGVARLESAGEADEVKEASRPVVSTVIE